MDGPESFEYAARYRTRCAIKAMRDEFAAGEVLVYWKYAYSTYDNARGWFFRQPGRRVVRSYDLYGGEQLPRDELFERLEGPRPVVVAAAAGDVAGIELAVSAAVAGDAEAALDQELAAERSLQVGREAAFGALLASAGFDHHTRVRLLQLAAEHGRAGAIAALLGSGLSADAVVSGQQQTALVPAVFGGHIEAVRLLLEAGADPAAAGPFARDPRMIELLEGSS